MPGMEVTIVKKGAKGPMEDDDALVEDAIREVAGRIDGYDAERLMSSYRDKMSPKAMPEEMAEGASHMAKEDCPDCAKGECANPEHMDEEALRALLSGMGGE